MRVVDGVLVEHWDVIEDDASRDASKSGLPMIRSPFVTVAARLGRPTLWAAVHHTLVSVCAERQHPRTPRQQQLLC